jgi:glycosyltransferase involved in cell wall biosynthesis
MKILFTLDALINAGTERSMLDIARHFSKDIEVHLAYFYLRHDLKEAYEQAGISVHFLDLKGKYDFRQGIHRLEELVKALKPDLMVSSLLRANLMTRMVARKTNIPLVGTFVNDSYGKARQDEKSGLSYWKFRFFWMLDRITASIPVHYISNAECIADSNAKALGIPKTKISTVHRGRDSNKYQKWNSPKQKEFHFVAIGRLLQRKGFEELIKATKICLKFQLHIRVTIYGEGSHRAALEALIKRHKLEEVISLPGNVPNAWEKLYDAHCFVFPSWYEGFSGALVEAMMVGLPIIASGIPMNLEAVSPKTARIHASKNASSFAQNMLWVMNHYEEAKEMGKMAREEAFNRFDIRIIAAQYEQVLRNIYKQSSRA